MHASTGSEVDSHDLADVVEANHPAQSVGAEHQHVASLQLAVREVDLDGVGRAEGLEDDVVVLERLGFLFRELTGLDELIHERLVPGELHELPLSQEVAA